MSEDSELPPAVERFVVMHVPSVVRMEALRLLRSRTAEAVAVDGLAAALFIHASEAARGGGDLCRLGLARAEGEPARF